MKTMKILRVEMSLTLRKIFESTGIDPKRLYEIEEGMVIATDEEIMQLERFFERPIHFNKDPLKAAHCRELHTAKIERYRSQAHEFCPQPEVPTRNRP